jgi:hypothetical protein
MGILKIGRKLSIGTSVVQRVFKLCCFPLVGQAHEAASESGSPHHFHESVSQDHPTRKECVPRPQQPCVQPSIARYRVEGYSAGVAFRSCRNGQLISSMKILPSCTASTEFAISISLSAAVPGSV